VQTGSGTVRARHFPVKCRPIHDLEEPAGHVVALTG
jgi:hypothetical protein